MQAVQKSQQFRRHQRVPLGPGGAQTAAGSAGVVDGVALGATFRVDAQTDLFAGLLGRRAVRGQLGGTVKDDMVRVL